ncbi:MAG: hypothetical protein V1914_04425 [archaeon]
MVAQQEQEDPSQILTELINRIRVLESKQSLFNEQLLLVNQNIIEEFKSFMNEIKTVRTDINIINKDLKNLKNIMKHLSEEAANFAKKDKLMVLEKYINLWNPLNFVTRTEVEKLINQKDPIQETIIKKEGTKVAKRSPNR